jgi:hypothetical protein
MPLPTLQQRLDEAIQARHSLAIGKKSVTIGYGTRRVEYTPTTLAQLDAYIAELRREIAGTSRAPVRSRVRYVVPG